MADIECDICFRSFNGNDRKPRNQPCGHVACSICIDENISRGFVYCSTCRSPHHANAASGLQVNFYIMKLVDQLPKPKKPKETTDDFNGGLCPEHKSCHLYFVCRTHNKEICRECTVIDHNPNSCDVISFKNQMEEKRSAMLKEVDAEINSITESISHLNDYERGKNNDVKFKSGEIERLLKEVDEDRKAGNEAEKAKVESTKLKKSLESARETLKDADKIVEIKESCTTVKAKVRCSKIWIEDLMKNFAYKLSESLFIKNPKSFLRMFYNSRQEVFIVHQAGSTQRSAELKVKDGMIILSSLQMNIKPTRHAVTIKSMKLTLNQEGNLRVEHQIQHSPTLTVTPKVKLSKVFISFSSENINLNTNRRQMGMQSKHLGRREQMISNQELQPSNTVSSKQGIGTVYISIDTQAPQAEQFLTLFTGIQGYSYMGSPNIQVIRDNVNGSYAIFCQNCTQENGTFAINTYLFSQNRNTINKIEKGKICLYGNCGFIIYHENPPNNQNYQVIGSVVSGLETISKIAEKLTENVNQVYNHNAYGGAQQTQVQISVDEVGVVIQSE